MDISDLALELELPTRAPPQPRPRTHDPHIREHSPGHTLHGSDLPPAYAEVHRDELVSRSQTHPLSAPAYACIVLRQYDTVRILCFPEEAIDVVRQILATSWPAGLQEDLGFGRGGREFKLSGRPWLAKGHEAVPSKRLLIHLLQALSNAGWHLAATPEFSGPERDRDTLMFRAGPPVDRRVFAVTFTGTDKVRIIDAAADVETTFVQTVQQWPAGITESEPKEEGCYQMRLRGTPFLRLGGTGIHLQLLTMQLMIAFDELGYEVMATVNMNTAAKTESSDIDAWFFGSKMHI